MILPILLFIPSWTPFLEHYYVASIPPDCLLTRVGLFWLLGLVQADHRHRLMVRLAAIGIVAVITTQTLWFQGLLRYIDVTPLPEQGTPLH